MSRQRSNANGPRGEELGNHFTSDYITSKEEKQVEDRNIIVAIETLAAEISLLRYTNQRLEAENAALKAAIESGVKVSVEVCGDE